MNATDRDLMRAAPTADTRVGTGRVVLGVLGGSGGVGASCLAAAVATRAAVRGACALVVDSDPTFGRLDALFDLDGVAGVRWGDLAGARGRLDGAALLGMLPRSAEGVRVLAGGGQVLGEGESEPRPETMASAVAALVGHSGSPTVTVLDLQRAAPALAHLSVFCSDIALVIGSGVSALACAEPAARRARALTPTTGRCWLAQRGPRSRRDVADAVAEATGLPLLTFVDDDPGLDERLARGCAPGTGKGPLASAGSTVLRRLASGAAGSPRGPGA